MSYIEIYWYGWLVTYLAGIVRLTYAKADENCNITMLECVFMAVPIYALASWIGLVILLGVEIYKKRNNLD